MRIVKVTAAVLILSAVMCAGITAASPLSDSYYLGEIPDAAAIGRGGAYCAVCANPYASYWNPAGLAALKCNNFTVSSNMFSESKLDSSAVNESYPLEGRNINFVSVSSPEVGLYWRPLSMRVDRSTWTGGGSEYSLKIDEKINVFGITVAVPHNDRVDFGMNINFIFGTMGYILTDGANTAAEIPYGYGWGLDWGMIYKATPNVNFGLTLLNGPAKIYWEKFSDDTLPPILRAGFDIRLTELMSAGIDYEKGFYDDSRSDESVAHFGLEQYVTREIILRGGVYGRDLDDKYSAVYTAGIGYEKSSCRIDFAVRQFYLNEDESNCVKRFSLSGFIPF